MLKKAKLRCHRCELHFRSLFFFSNTAIEKRTCGFVFEMLISFSSSARWSFFCEKKDTLLRLFHSNIRVLVIVFKDGNNMNIETRNTKHVETRNHLKPSNFQRLCFLKLSGVPRGCERHCSRCPSTRRG